MVTFVVGFLGIALGALIEFILAHKHEIYGGTIVIDLGVDSNDTIKVEAASRFEDWMKADKIIFDKEVRG